MVVVETTVGFFEAADHYGFDVVDVHCLALFFLVIAHSKDYTHFGIFLKMLYGIIKHRQLNNG